MDGWMDEKIKTMHSLIFTDNGTFKKNVKYVIIFNVFLVSIYILTPDIYKILLHYYITFSLKFNKSDRDHFHCLSLY